MWSCEISINKEYKREFDYLESHIKQCKNLSFAVEESRERYFVYIATLCDNREEVQQLVEKAICEVYLTYIKLSCLVEKIHHTELSHSFVALLSSLLYFDRQFEESVVLKALHEVATYNIDGILNFRLQTMTSNWEELSNLANNLVKVAPTSEDVFNVATFLVSTEGGKNKLLIEKSSAFKIYNTTGNYTVEIKDVFDEPEHNLILAAISECPSEIVLRNVDLSSSMQRTLEKLARVQVETLAPN